MRASPGLKTGATGRSISMAVLLSTILIRFRSFGQRGHSRCVARRGDIVRPGTPVLPPQWV
eukprot:1126585-Prymnesium_polylepis.1